MRNDWLLAGWRRLFQLWERLGFHITRNHFYSPIPDTRQLGDEIWRRQSELVGLDLQDDRQLELIQLFTSRYKGEFDELPWLRAGGMPTGVENMPFDIKDSVILYCMVRLFQPSRIIEVGSGHSTVVFANAVLKNEEECGKKADLTAIEPYPNDNLKKGFPGLSRLIARRVEQVDLAEFDALGENDILFIDSSHVLRIGNDVQYEYLEVLPRLNKGVLVHIHDIYLPQEYPRKLVLDWGCFWNEQYLVQAFLAFNSAFEVIWAGNYMRLKHPEELERVFGDCDPNAGGLSSLWIRRVA